MNTDSIARAEKEGDRAYRAAVAALSGMLVTCRRCGGRGTYRLASGADGDCFGCGGTGKQDKDKGLAARAQAAGAKAKAAVMLPVLRAALTLAEAGQGWASRSEARSLRSQIATYEVSVAQ